MARLRSELVDPEAGSKNGKTSEPREENILLGPENKRFTKSES